MKNTKIIDLFFREGEYHFSRWTRPIAPVVFGVDNDSLTAIKVAFSDVIVLTPIALSDVDPDLGANFLLFFCSKWSELSTVPNLSKLIPTLSDLLESLEKIGANQYRTFSFTSNGAIKVVVVLLKYDRELSSVSIQTLATSQMLQSLLLWSPNAFKSESPIAIIEETNRCVIKPFYSALIKAAYDPVLPDCSNEAAHAIRLQARVDLLMGIK